MCPPGHHPFLYRLKDDEQRGRHEEQGKGAQQAELSVQQVAEMLGFSDQSAFGKFFKRECGVSPAQYRKRQGKNAASEDK